MKTQNSQKKKKKKNWKKNPIVIDKIKRKKEKRSTYHIDLISANYKPISTR